MVEGGGAAETAAAASETSSRTEAGGGGGVGGEEGVARQLALPLPLLGSYLQSFGRWLGAANHNIHT